MPNITGTSNADDLIDVINDVGTLNGGPPVTPVDNIILDGNNSTVNLGNSDVGTIRQRGFDLEVNASDSTISNIVLQTTGPTTLNFTNTDVAGNINAGNGSLDITWSGGTLSGSVSTGSSASSFNFSGTTLNGNFDFGAGGDVLTFDNATIGNGVNFDLGTGSNVVEITGNTIVGTGAGLSGGNGIDTLTVPDGTTITIGGDSYVVGVNTPPDGFNQDGVAVLPNGEQISFDGFDSFASSGPVCFAAGTMIETPEGPISVETLRVGDRLCDIDGTTRPIIWIGRINLRFNSKNAHHLPIEFKLNSLGQGVPNKPLIVSPQHRILIEMPTIQSEVFAPAKGLIDLPGVRICKGKRDVIYHALLLDRHSVVFANGTPVESFFPGSAALEFMGNRLRYELTTALMSLGRDYGPIARPCITLRQARELCQVLNARKAKMSGFMAA